MLIFAGLGNPGARYARNRHNIGFMAVDEIARAHRASPWRSRFQAEALWPFQLGRAVVTLSSSQPPSGPARSLGSRHEAGMPCARSQRTSKQRPLSMSSAAIARLVAFILVLTGAVWFGFETRRFRGPPIGDEVARRQAEIAAAEKAVGEV